MMLTSAKSLCGELRSAANSEPGREAGTEWHAKESGGCLAGLSFQSCAPSAVHACDDHRFRENFHE